MNCVQLDGEATQSELPATPTACMLLPVVGTDVSATKTPPVAEQAVRYAATPVWSWRLHSGVERLALTSSYAYKKGGLVAYDLVFNGWW